MRNEDMSEPLQVARAWIAAFNAHDVTGIVALYTAQAELYDAGMRHRRQGRQQIADWFSRRFAALPEISYLPADEIVEGERVAITWTVRGYTPRLLGQRWLARPFAVEGVSVFAISAGQIARQRGYYDHLAVVERALPFLRLLPSRV
jgi:steroid delta-isomerase-like uncharacterized protein